MTTTACVTSFRICTVLAASVYICWAFIHICYIQSITKYRLLRHVYLQDVVVLVKDHISRNFKKYSLSTYFLKLSKPNIRVKELLKSDKEWQRYGRLSVHKIDRYEYSLSSTMTSQLNTKFINVFLTLLMYLEVFFMYLLIGIM